MPDSVRPETTLDRSRSREKRRAAGDGFVKEEAVVTVQAEQGTRPQGGPGGRGTKERRAASQRREAPLGGWYHAGPGGRWSAQYGTYARGEKQHEFTDSAESDAKGWVTKICGARYRGAQVQNVQRDAEYNSVLRDPRAPSESAPERDGRESGGRGRPAADGRAGPFRPERTPFFPSLSVR